MDDFAMWVYEISAYAKVIEFLLCLVFLIAIVLAVLVYKIKEWYENKPLRDRRKRMTKQRESSEIDELWEW